ncbi:MAG: hypothetical protein N4A33_03645 [Bacteriovoracaceae bacterium]|jgi:DNA-directed RNA polymerase specialized sigma24 family protein|nr:hypothetical protein [Bacteriovoracaceae bacterium]
MNNETLEQLISPLVNKIYSFCYAIVPDDLLAQQLFVDGYTKFVLKDKKEILITDITDKEDRVSFKDYAFKRILSEIILLSKARTKTFMYKKRTNMDEFNVFYSLTMDSRIVIHLDTVLDFTKENIMEVFGLPKNEVVNLIFFAKNELLNIKQGQYSASF